MASTERGRELTELHRRAQVGVGAAVMRQMTALWRLLDPNDFSTVDAWLLAVLPLLRRSHGESAALAAGYYRRFRAVEAGREPSGTLPRAGFDDESVRARLLWAGPLAIVRQLNRGKPMALASRDARALSATYAQNIVVNGGRDTVMQSVATDRQALGWSRTTDGAPCAFCAMLAGRGPVYKTETGADFQAHRSCGCGAEPVFSRDQAWPPGARRWADLYAQEARGREDPLNAFRRAYQNNSAG